MCQEMNEEIAITNKYSAFMKIILYCDGWARERENKTIHTNV